MNNNNSISNSNSNSDSNNDLLSYSLEQSLQNLTNATNGIPFEISQVESTLLNNKPTPTESSVNNDTKSTSNKNHTPSGIPSTTASYNNNQNNNDLNSTCSLTPSQKLLKTNNTTQLNQSIDKLWNQLFNVPISLEREKRIQQALDFMEAENKAHRANDNVVKHSFRQISQFFSVPKSTLYDRTRLKQNGKPTATPEVKSNTTLKSDGVAQSSPSNSVNESSTNTPVLLKNDDINDNGNVKETDPEITTPMQKNLPINKSNPIVLDQNSILDKATILAENTTTKKVDNPIDVRYKRYEVQMKLSVNKEFELLNEMRLISQVYGNIISKNQMDEYIKSHVDSKIELGKTWLRSFLNRHKDHIIYGNENCYNTLPIQLIKKVKGNSDCLRKCIVDDVHYRLNEYKAFNPHVYIICFLPLSNFGVNKNSITLCLDVSVNEGTVKFVLPPRLLMYSTQTSTNNNGKDYEEQWSIKENYNQDKINSINNGIKYMINACVKRHQSSNSEYIRKLPKPLILFEGFTEAFHWDIKLCEKVLELSDFLTIPCNEHIFRDILFHHLHQKLFQTMETIDINSSGDDSCHEFNIGIDEFIPSFSHDVFTTFFEAFVEEKSYDDEDECDVKKDNKLNLSKASMGAWSVSSVIEVNKLDNSRNNSNNTLPSNGSSIEVQKNANPSLGSPINLTQLSDINFNNFNQYNENPPTGVSWENVMDLINNNEQHLYNQLSHSKDKELLKTIFTKVKKFSPT